MPSNWRKIFTFSSSESAYSVGGECRRHLMQLPKASPIDLYRRCTLEAHYFEPANPRTQPAGPAFISINPEAGAVTHHFESKSGVKWPSLGKACLSSFTVGIWGRRSRTSQVATG